MNLSSEQSRSANQSVTEHFATDHLLPNLRERTVSSGVITAAAQAAQFFLNLGFTIILARLLTPRDFGLVAMVTTIMGFLFVFREIGLSTATVQCESISHRQVSNLFWINTGVGAFITALVALTAPLFGRFYHEPAVTSIALALSGAFLLNGLGVQHMALLNRQMRFRAVSLIEVLSTGLGLAIGMVVALFEFSYWSLVVATMSTAILRTAAAWITCKWRPQLASRDSGTWPLLRFGASLSVSGFLYSFSRGCDILLLGRFVGSDAVGLYSRAAGLFIRPLEQVLSPINTVIVPVLSRMQTDPARYRRAYYQVFEPLAIGSAVFAGIFLPLALPLTLVVLGVQWEAAAPIFAALTPAALYFPLASAASWLYSSQGRGNHLLRVSVVAAISMIVCFVIGLGFGPTGVAIGFSISGVCIQLPYTFYVAGREGPVGTGDLWRALLRHLPIYPVVCLTTWLSSRWMTDFHPITKLVVCTLAGSVSGGLFILIWPPSRRTVLSLVRTVKEFKAGTVSQNVATFPSVS